MKDYNEFLKNKEKKHIHSGFESNDLNEHLKPFQKFIVKKALNAGKYAIFADTGLGKTIMQLSWADSVAIETCKPVLVLAPLAVVQQTIDEAHKFDIQASNWYDKDDCMIDVANYEQLDNIDVSIYSGVVLDESSILKSFDGKTSNKIIQNFKQTPYKLACSATPSPNDHTELGMHSEFLDAMSYHEMLAMYFVHDGGETSKWRLRKHAENDFWNFVLSWSIAVDHPKTFGFNDNGYDLPKLNVIEHFVDVESDGLDLFGEAIVSATDLHRDLKKTFDKRMDITRNLVNESDKQWLIWGIQNRETDHLSKIIKNSVNVQGSDKPEIKGRNLNGFANNEFQNLITKAKIASFGMNYQNCHNMIFTAYDFSFEAIYQAIRRCLRFGQKHEVNVHFLIPKTQTNVRRSFLDKEKKHKERIHNLAVKSFNFQKFEKEYSGNVSMTIPKWLN